MTEFAAKATMTVPAEDVREGDFLPGLDNGYVYQPPETGNGYLSYPSTGGGGYNVAMPESTVVLSFHTAEGDEAYLLVPADMPVTVKR